jgi:anhydro-N-acetylmuramic acid kinase
VPIGDKLLFGKQEACLNIGGIANISFDDKNGNRIAYDICEANMLLNYLAEKVGRDYDEGGELAKNGSVNTELLNKLNSQNYYSQTGAKSIGREWFEQNILPLVQKGDIKINDLLATSTEHISQIIANDLVDKKNVLVTGGGAFNSFLIEKISLFF